MRSKADLARKQRGGRARRRTPKPPGGKALRRLFTFLAQRDPALNDDIVATVAVPKAARPNYALTKQALRARPVTAATAARARRSAPASKAYASSIIKAAAKLTKRKKAQTGRRMTTRAADTAPPEGESGKARTRVRCGYRGPTSCRRWRSAL